VQVPLNFHESDGDAFNVIEVVKEVQERTGRPVRLIIADTLARMSSGANENAGQDMGAVMTRFDLVKDATGAAILIIHHSGKDTARGARGWSGIQAHVDTEIEVTETEESRCAEITKQRELSSKGDSIFFTLEIVEMGQSKFGEVATTCVAVFDRDAQKADPKKGSSKKGRFMHTFQKAWIAAGMELNQGVPYLSRSAFADFLATTFGYTERTIKNQLNPAYDQNIIGYLLRYECIKAYGNGWLMNENEVISTSLLLKNSSP
jgi:hypothetical protein